MQMIDLQYEIVTKYKGITTVNYQGDNFNTFIKTFDECEYHQNHKKYLCAISTYNGFSDYFSKFVFNVTFDIVNEFKEDFEHDS